MDLVKQLVDVFLHLDRHLADVVRDYGTWTNVILFGIVFCETGLVVTPFLPGRLAPLHGRGARVARHARTSGCSSCAPLARRHPRRHGRTTGSERRSARAPSTEPCSFLKQEHLRKTEEFYEKHGRKTIILARFVPIVRTFAPFVAGVGSMTLRRLPRLQRDRRRRLGRGLRLRGLLLRQHPGREEELLARHPRDHRRLDAAAPLGNLEGTTAPARTGRMTT